MSTSVEEDLRKSVRSGEALLVVGAGVSAASTTQPVATWRGLLRDGVERASDLGRLPGGELSDFRALADSDRLDDLLQVADVVTTALGGRNGGEYSRWLRETVGGLRPEKDALLSAIADSQIPLATTNYDELLEGATGLEATTWQRPSVFQRVVRGDERAILHLHGFWRKPESVVLGSASYGDVVSDPFASFALRAIAFTRSLIFVGFGSGLEDPNFHSLRLWMREVLAESEYRHFRLVRSRDLEVARALHSIEERIVPIAFGDEHSELPAFLRTLGQASVLVSAAATTVQEAVAAEQSLARSRIVQRFMALGLAPDLAEDLSDDSSIGPPPAGVGGAGVRLVVGEAGIGKSTSADRLYMQQLALFEAGADRRVPVYMRARDVAPGELSMRVLEASQFGDVVHDGAVVIIDGADEPGPSTAQGILEDAVELFRVWPTSSVTVFSRDYEPSPSDDGLAPWETQWMPHLSQEQATALRLRIGATESDPWPWGHQFDRQAGLPVFVLIVTQYLRDAPADLSKSDAIALVRDAVIGEAIAGSEVDPSFFEELAADWISSSGEVTVRDVAPSHELKSAVSRCRVLAVDARGFLSFRIPEVAWSLAAQYLARDVTRFDEIVEDATARHLWMPAVDVVIGAGSIEVGNGLLHRLARHAPGLAASRVGGFRMEESDQRADFESEVQRVEEAMASWIDGIGALKSLAVPHIGDEYAAFKAEAGPSGVSSAWRGFPSARIHHINRPYMGRHWEWGVTSKDLATRLEAVLKVGLPAATDVARHEAEYEIATRLTHAPRVASMARTIEFAELDAAASGDLPNVALMQPPMIAAASAVARLLVSQLRDRGDVAIKPPWPAGDDLTRMRWIWDGWSIEGLLDRGRQVSRAALEIYREIVDRWFPTFASELRLTSLWPVRLLAFAEFDSQNRPVISWTFEPLEITADSEVVWRRGALGFLEFPGDSTADVIRRRPDLKGRYFHSVQGGPAGLFALDPATETAMDWLRDDLQALHWVSAGVNQSPAHSVPALVARANAVLQGVVLPPL